MNFYLQDLEIFLPDILSGQEEVDSFRSHSPDIKGPSRARANTALMMRQKMMKMKGEQDNVKVVLWKSPKDKDIHQELEQEELFPKKNIMTQETPISKLSQQLEQLGQEELNNPWQEYGM